MQRLARPAGGDSDGRSRRRRVPGVITAAVACALSLAVAVAAPPAVAQQPSPGADDPVEESPPAVEVPEAVPGEEVCSIADPRLDSLSGLVAHDDQFIVINDSQPIGLEDRQPVFFLDQDCAVVDEQPFPPRPFDPEDLELDPDSGTLWVADIGDNFAAGTGETPRDTIALWSVDLSGGDRTPVIHRFVYPDGEGRDAEALLLDSDGTPIIVTKEIGTAGLYVPTDLVPDNPAENAVPLELVGEFSPPDTGTEHRFGVAGRQVITGGAVSPDGSAVVLRTYADAFEFDVVDGDVVGAIADGEPRITPLPGEPQGEAITYTPDGQHFLTVSEVPDDQQSFNPAILRYDPTPPAPDPTPAPEEAPPAESGGGGFSLFNDVQDILNVVAAIGLLGLLLVAIGVFGIVRYRRRHPRTSTGKGNRSDDEDDAAEAGAVGRASARVDAAAGAGAAAVPATAAVATPEPRSEPGWEPGWDAGWEPEPAPVSGNGQAAGVYTSRTAAGYDPGYDPGSYYPDAESGYADHPGYPQYEGQQGYDEYGGYYGNETYGASGYPEDYHQPQQRAADGGTYQAGTYQAGAYEGGHYQQGEYHHGEHYQEGDYYQGGAYQGGTYRAGEAVPDYYSDDPDYPYEFRDRDRW